PLTRALPPPRPLSRFLSSPESLPDATGGAASSSSDPTVYNYTTVNKALAGLRRINLDGLRWRVFDAKGQVLGQLASQIAVVLQGKDKPTYAPHVENRDMCVVLNAKDISVAGRKMTDKIY
ncbi:Os05g0243100, partial [Oryza sativa Japonica Group]